MFSYIKSFITKTKSTLFSFNNEPFSRFSILLIIILDIFLFITILTGIDSEKNMSPMVSVKYPAQCKNHFDEEYKNSVWNNATRGYTYDTFPFREYDSFYIPTHTEYYSGKNIQVYDDKRMASLCKELYEKIAVFAHAKEFKNNIEDSYHSTIEDMGVDLSLMQLEYEVNEMEKRLIKERNKE